MESLLNRVLLLTWGVWLGGLLGVFLGVTTLFATLDPDRTTAGLLGAAIFHRAERFILLAGAVCLLATLGLVIRRRSIGRLLVLALLAVATLVALANTLVITPRIDRLRQAAQTQTPEFRRAHGTSMGLYSSQAVLLAAAGLVLPSALTRQAADPA